MDVLVNLEGVALDHGMARFESAEVAVGVGEQVVADRRAGVRHRVYLNEGRASNTLGHLGLELNPPYVPRLPADGHVGHRHGVELWSGELWHQRGGLLQQGRVCDALRARDGEGCARVALSLKGGRREEAPSGRRDPRAGLGCAGAEQRQAAEGGR